MLMANQLVQGLQRQPVAGILFCFIVGDIVNNWVFLTTILYKGILNFLLSYFAIFLE